MGEIEKVPLAAYEAQAERDHKTLRYLIAGWVITCALFAFVVCMMISYDEETVYTSSDVDQNSGDYGSNVFAGGDYYGSTENPNGKSDGKEATRD